jgi:hypothetical protein
MFHALHPLCFFYDFLFYTRKTVKLLVSLRMHHLVDAFNRWPAAEKRF